MTRPAKEGRSAGVGTAATPDPVRFGVIAVVILRLALIPLPGMWAWGLGTARFAGPLGWALAAVPLVMLLPRAARALECGLAKAGDALARRPGAGALLAFVGVAILVLALPDRSHFVGDYLLREGRLNQGTWSAEMFPQAMPLDVLLHFFAPVGIGHALGIPPAEANRWASALEAGALAVSAVVLTRALGFRRVAALAVPAIAIFTGSLAIFCGYSKAFVELSLFTAAFAAFGVRELEQRRGFVAATVVLALALATHRSALLMLPAWGALAVVRIRRSSRATGRATAWGAIAALALVAIGIAPRMFAAMRAVDRVHLLPGATLATSLAMTFAPVRLLDFANLLILLCPVLPLLPLVALRDREAAPRPGTGRWLVLLAFTHALAMLFMNPRQGWFRDWDVAAGTGVALAALAAWRVGIALSRSRLSAAAGVGLVLLAIGASLTWMALNGSLERTLKRVEAYVSEPPPRSAEDLGLSLRYLGIVYQDSGMDDQAERALERAATLAPSESNMALWAGEEVRRGRLREAQRIYRSMTVRNGTYASWLALARCSALLRDRAELTRAAGRALALRPGDAEATRMLAEADSARVSAR